MLCRIYRSGLKEETYLYLRADLPFEELPEPLQASFGQPHFVMALSMSESRKLSRVDARQVMAALDSEGFYLQLPPKIPVEEEITRRFS